MINFMENIQINPNQLATVLATEHLEAFVETIIEEEHIIISQKELVIKMNEYMYDENGNYNEDVQSIYDEAYEHFYNRIKLHEIK